ncbi:Trimethylguanosine synthase [Astathelohania contejeani]|uniref:Trimethylguanosine synthase n=1 Tax=Astathelohania contejeani TaxID=164912 RepID=A0ABQ7I1V4_9MICR|nr:Trimethylguanosine synthase [Thelohania contejeani]
MKYTIIKKYNGWTINDDTISYNPELRKYHYKRYKLFRKLNMGIIMDVESWYSVTPEEVITQIIDKIMDRVDKKYPVLCGFCGVGGDVIPLLESGYKVVAIDSSYNKIKYLKVNKQIYLKQKGFLKTIVDDYYKFIPEDKYSFGIITPPWGGINYKEEKSFNLEKINFQNLFNRTKEIVKNFVILLPRNCDKKELQDFCGECEIEDLLFENRVIAIGLFYGNMFLKPKI